MHSKTIDIYDYEDFHAFLKAWFGAKRARSYAWFARQVGMSKSMVASVVNGKRALQEHWIMQFARALQLSGSESEYFRDLVIAKECTDRGRRRVARGRIRAERRFRAALSRDQALYFKIYSRWYYLALVELARCAGFRPDPAWIVSALTPEITEDQAQEALEVLEDIGLLVYTEDGGVEIRESVLTRGHESHNRASRQLHPELFRLADESMSYSGGEERQIEAMTFAIPEDRLGEFREAVRRFQRENIDRAASAERGADRVYQLCVQLFPLSGRTDRVDLTGEE